MHSFPLQILLKQPVKMFQMAASSEFRNDLRGNCLLVPRRNNSPGGSDARVRKRLSAAKCDVLQLTRRCVDRPFPRGHRATDRDRATQYTISRAGSTLHGDLSSRRYTAPRCSCRRPAGPCGGGALKMQDWKQVDKNAGLENGGPNEGRHY